MIEENNISPMSSDFEQIKKSTEDGQEYWSSRELSTALGYSSYQKFSRTLNKAIAVANQRGLNINDHFNQTVEMVRLGSGTFRKVENMHLSRMACLIIAENADGKRVFQTENVGHRTYSKHTIFQYITIQDQTGRNPY